MMSYMMSFVVSRCLMVSDGILWFLMVSCGVSHDVSSCLMMSHGVL